MLVKRRLLLVNISIIICVILGLYCLIQYYLNPYRALNQFLNAIIRKDIDTIYMFILDEEKQQNNLNKEDISRILDFVFYRYIPKINKIKWDVVVPPPADRWLEKALVIWINEETNQPLMINGRKVFNYVHLFRPPGRWMWQVSFTHFIKDHLYLNISPFILKQQGWTEEKIKNNYKLYTQLREITTKNLFKYLGIKKLYPLPSKILRKGRYIVIWQSNS